MRSNGVFVKMPGKNEREVKLTTTNKKILGGHFMIIG